MSQTATPEQEQTQDERTEAKRAEDAEKAAKEQAKQEAAAKKAEGKAAKEAERATKQAAKEAEKQKRDEERATAKAEREKIAAEKKAEREAKREAREAEKAKKAEERASRPKVPPMTLSQRRATLNLADGPMRPTTAMNRTPLDYLVSVGVAQVQEIEEDREATRKVPNPKASEDGQPKELDEAYTETVVYREYTLTDEGKAVAERVNPKWKTWKPDR